MNLFLSVLETNALITAFVVVALVLWISNSLAKTLVKGKSLVPKPASGIMACLIIKIIYL